MRIKGEAWFASGPEVLSALRILSDGGFRLYFFLCVNANRNTARIRFSYTELAKELKRSRGSVASHADELREKRVCIVAPAVNQHSRTEFEICDEFWPYTKDGKGIPPSDFERYCAAIRSLLSKRACVECKFGPTDDRFAAELLARKISIEEIERAIALACCRKYVGLLNGTDHEMIRRLSYFRDSIEEVRDPDAHPIQASQLSKRLETVQYLEEKWLAKRKRTVGVIPQ